MVAEYDRQNRDCIVDSRHEEFLLKLERLCREYNVYTLSGGDWGIEVEFFETLANGVYNFRNVSFCRDVLTYEVNELET